MGRNVRARLCCVHISSSSSEKGPWMGDCVHLLSYRRCPLPLTDKGPWMGDGVYLPKVSQVAKGVMQSSRSMLRGREKASAQPKGRTQRTCEEHKGVTLRISASHPSLRAEKGHLCQLAAYNTRNNLISQQRTARNTLMTHSNKTATKASL